MIFAYCSKKVAFKQQSPYISCLEYIIIITNFTLKGDLIISLDFLFKVMIFAYCSLWLWSNNFLQFPVFLSSVWIF